MDIKERVEEEVSVREIDGAATEKQKPQKTGVTKIEGGGDLKKKTSMVINSVTDQE